MKIKYMEGDLFEAVLNREDDSTVFISHVCNNKNKWGAGFVLPLHQHFPNTKIAYHDWFSKDLTQAAAVQSYRATGDAKLGETQLVNVAKNIYVINMIAQTLGEGRRPLHYDHLVSCMKDVMNFIDETGTGNKEIIAPLFGSGLAGGDWNFIEKLIEDCWLSQSISVTIHYLSKFLPDNWSPEEEKESV